MWDLTTLEPSMRVALEEEFREGANMKAAQAEIAQRRSAAITQAARPRSLSFGHQIASVNPVFYHHFKRQGRSWMDRDWVKWILGKHESLRVESGPRKIYSAWSPAAENARFHRRYAVATA